MVTDFKERNSEGTVMVVLEGQHPWATILTGITIV